MRTVEISGPSTPERPSKDRDPLVLDAFSFFPVPILEFATDQRLCFAGIPALAR